MIGPLITTLLNDLLLQMQTTFGSKLVGLYLYGSLVTGDFDPASSDVDLLAVIASDLDETEFNGLKRMHDEIVRKDQTWDNRIEVAYASTHALKVFKTQRHALGIISPGEPFHIIEAGKEWLMNWYVVQQKGVTLFGPPPQTLIDPTSKEEYVQAVRDSVAAAVVD